MTRVRVELAKGVWGMFENVSWGWFEASHFSVFHIRKSAAQRRCLFLLHFAIELSCVRFFSSPEPRERLACFPLNSSDSHSSHITIFGSFLILWIYMLWVCIFFCLLSMLDRKMWIWGRISQVGWRRKLFALLHGTVVRCRFYCLWLLLSVDSDFFFS